MPSANSKKNIARCLVIGILSNYFVIFLLIMFKPNEKRNSTLSLYIMPPYVFKKKSNFDKLQELAINNSIKGVSNTELK